MEQWQTLVIALLMPASGGSLWVGIRWFLARRDALEESRQAHETMMEQSRQSHETKLADRFDGMQRAFLQELDAIEEKLERHRTEHLADTKKYAESLAEVTRLLQKRQDSSRPGS